MFFDRKTWRKSFTLRIFFKKFVKFVSSAFLQKWMKLEFFSFLTKLSSSVRLHPATDFSGFLQIFLDFSGFFWIFLDFSGFFWIFLDFSGFFRIFPDFSGFSRFFWIFPDFSDFSDFSGFSGFFRKLFKKNKIKKSIFS